MVRVMSTENHEEEAQGVPALTLADLKPTDDYFTHPDSSLQDIVTFANAAGTGIGVRLLVDGSVVSGTVVSADEFYRWASERLGDASVDQPQSRELLSEYRKMFFDDPAAHHRSLREDESYDHYEHVEIARHIHLANAKVFTGGVPFDFGYTRVLLAHVAAWSVGSYGPPPEEGS